MKFKPIETEEVEACQFDPDRIDELPKWFQEGEWRFSSPDNQVIAFKDYNGERVVAISNDFIIKSKERKGWYVLPPGVFELVFEEIKQPERNALLDPRPGDIFRYGKDLRERHITKREIDEGGDTISFRDVRESGDRGLLRVPMSTWKNWVKKSNPEVIQLAEWV